MSARRHRLPLALATVLALSAGLLIAPAANDAAHAAAEWSAPVHHGVSALQPCADIVVVGVRGSGQTHDQNEGFGPEVADVRDRLHAIVGEQRSVRQVEVDYESQPVYAAMFVDFGQGEVGNYFLNSIGNGEDALRTVIDDSRERCPEERMVLIGYSQGALVVRRQVSVEHDTDKFAGIVLVADPGRRVEDIAIRGSAAPGVGLTGWTGDLSSLPLDGVKPAVVSVCNALDAVCDTANLMATPEAAIGLPGFLGAMAAGVDVHTAYVGTPEMQSAAAHVATRVLSYAVPRAIDFDVPIGDPFSVQLTTKSMNAGTSAEWRLDPWSTAPGSVVLSPSGTLTGQLAAQGNVFVQVEVRGPVGDWRKATVGLRVGAGAHCPQPDDLLELTATPRDPGDIWVDAPTSAAPPTLSLAAEAETAAASDSPTLASLPLSSTGVEESVVVAQSTSARRDPNITLRGHFLASPAGQLIDVSGELLVYRAGVLDPIRSISDSTVWDPNGYAPRPQWLRGELITGFGSGLISGVPADVLTWETLDGTTSGNAEVLGTFLTGSDVGWYEAYRWPSQFGCGSDGTLVVRQVDVTGASVVRTNVAVAPPTLSSAAVPLLAESGGDGRSLGILTAVANGDAFTDLQVHSWARGDTRLRTLGTIQTADAAELTRWSAELDPTRGSDLGMAKLAVTGRIVSVHLPQRWRLPANWSGWPARGRDVASGVVYRFAPDLPARRWDAVYDSNLVTLAGSTIFDGPSHAALTLGYPNGTSAASRLSENDTRGFLTIASDGSRVFMPPGQNGPLTDEWIGTDQHLRGYVYGYSNPAVYAPVVVAQAPVVGNVGSVFNVSVSDDTITWTDDSVAGGAQWQRRVTASEPLALGAVGQVGTIISRMTDLSHGPWMQGDWSLRVAEDPDGWNTRLVASYLGAERWSEEIYNGPANYRIHDGRVDIGSQCEVVDLETGTSLIPRQLYLPAFVGEAGCSYIASDGTTVAWIDNNSVVWTIDTAGNRPAARVGTASGQRIRHFSLAGGTLLLAYDTAATGSAGTRFFTADLSDPGTPGPLTSHAGADAAAAVSASDHYLDGVVQITRDADHFGFSMGRAWEYRYAERTEYGGYRDASIHVFGVSSGAEVATIRPPSTQNYMYGPTVSLHGDLLAWSNGTGGVVLSRLAIEPATAPPVDRVAGVDRYATSAAISREAFDPGVPVAYVAFGGNFPDALSAGAVAGREGGPILLSATSGVPAVIGAELERLNPGRIVVIGGTGAISDAVLQALGEYTDGSVDRVAGVDRYATSAAISREAFDPGVPVAYVAFGGNFPDALSAGAVAGREGGPILLSATSGVPAVIGAELERLNPGRIVVIGGTGAISDAVMQALGEYTDGSVDRVAGVDRYATSAAI